jgi:hypothetical protein
MNHRFIIANIKIPIEIDEQGNLKTILDKKYIEYELCDKLPDITTKSTDIMSGITDFLHANKIVVPSTDPSSQQQILETNAKLDNKTQRTTEAIEPNKEKEQTKNPENTLQEEVKTQILITQEELANHFPTKKGNSQSFKKRPNNSHRFTSKRYPSIVLPKEDVDPSLPQEV